MTDQACYLYARAFARHVKTTSPEATRVSLAGDYRSSTPRIMRAVATALIDEGLVVENCGFVSTPAVTYQGMRQGQASVMVTGSHIPDDRNGIKFNMPWGEVLKPDEVEISRIYRELAASSAAKDRAFDTEGAFVTPLPDAETDDAARKVYVRRYLDVFPGEPLKGTKIVFYEHSTVCRDFFQEILCGLGVEVIPVGRSDAFVPLDTEAVRDPERLAAWVAEYGADALVTADGDGDRPLAVDEKGNVVRGDVLGILVADFMGADSVAAPVSCNTALEKSGLFAETSRTRIGSPYVIESLKSAIARGRQMVVGYEANGGFLTATDWRPEEGACILTALPTRDAVLPILALLLLGARRGQTLSQLVDALPPRFTWSGLQREVPSERGKALVVRFHQGGAQAVAEVFDETFGPVESLDFTDGARITFTSGDVVHLRPSGNAPEFRCYTESDTEARAAENNATALRIVKAIV
jgi:phosphomannomutase